MGKHLITIIGPTGIGKTNLAIKIANYFKTEIVSADSRQFYKEMNIGTAKPSNSELNSIKGLGPGKPKILVFLWFIH